MSVTHHDSQLCPCRWLVVTHKTGRQIVMRNLEATLRWAQPDDLFSCVKSMSSTHLQIYWLSVDFNSRGVGSFACRRRTKQMSRGVKAVLLEHLTFKQQPGKAPSR